jgi:carbonyl reductase 1
MFLLFNYYFNMFIRSAKTGDYPKHGWPGEVKGRVAYIASKIGVSALTRIQQRQFDQDPREDLVINHVHPGAVATGNI